MNFKHILFMSQNIPNDQALFDWILRLAQQHNAHLTVLSVLPELTANLTDWIKNYLPGDIIAQQTQNALSAMHPWAMQANQVGVHLSTQVEFGKPFYKAIQTVLKTNVDLMIKQTDQIESSLSHYVFGSQDLHLLRKCPCPVLLHKQGTSLPFERVMASIDVDIDAENLAPNHLNESILSLALAMAEHDDSALSVVHAWQAEAENLMRYWNSDLSDVDVLRFTESVHQQHAWALDHEIAAYRARKPNLNVMLPKGRAEQVIPQIAQDQNIDLIVMGTLGRSGLPGLVIGNTAETILEQIQCSVLAVKPSGFVSPITV
ncbi:universal stress protein [Thiomicrorhabdus aquaedulcis]|uniref:universal stress protein n=1 Tax=Thiomicrorhabdus aquaedulcis TaxID=2211106 RepID=UPI0015623DBA|nr:universal stress protein [Thiomicrorhabdus aquaedulcis]